MLPSPPLPPNPFADDMILSLDLAMETVVLAGRLWYQVYSEEELLEKLPAKYTLRSYRDVGSTEVMIVSSETTPEELGKILVVFRGTDDTPDGDWLTNLMIPQVPFGPPGKELYATTVVEGRDWTTGGIKNVTVPVRVHKGFNQVFSDDLYEYIVEKLQTEQLLGRTSPDGSSYYNNTVHFMGHSLGGANAQLMGTYFAHLNPEIQTYITTLGSPRQGNLAYKVFAESVPNLATWRLVFCNDIVPRVPNVRYYHAGHMMYFACAEDDGSSDSNPVGAYFRHAGDPILGKAGIALSKWIVSSSAGASMITDHLGGAYLQWLDSAYASLEGLQSNWTTVFESEEENKEDDERKLLQVENTNDGGKQASPQKMERQHQNYEQILQELKANGAMKGLRGFPIPH
mmetsp:Transcript_18922/g.46876  ORF Transcript_18922/g.46876 Transcript_18922/m.46876 type:complete len:400 (-) Transcript_18922:78-1277(-)